MTEDFIEFGKTPEHQLHDKFFRFSFSRKDIVEDYLRNFFDPNIVTKIKFDTLKSEPTSYISEKLKNYFSDVMWTCEYGKNQHCFSVRTQE
jgi:predicted transposase YdaD